MAEGLAVLASSSAAKILAFYVSFKLLSVSLLLLLFSPG